MRRRLVTVGVCAAALLGVSAGVAGMRLASSAAAVPTVESIVIDVAEYRQPYEQCFTPANMNGDGRESKCTLDLVKAANAARDFGPALGMLRDSTKRTYDMVGRCHNASHEVGWALIEAGMELNDVYRIPFGDCRFGLPHGALGKATEGWDIDRLKREIPTVCAPFGGPDTNETLECVHVLGHYIVDRIGTDLPESLRTCEVLTEVRMRSRCVDGVFMQSVDLARPGIADPNSPSAQRIKDTWGTTRAEQQATAVDACGSLPADQLKYVCWTAVSQTLSLLWKQDYPAVGRVCASAPEQGKQPCFEGIAAAAFTLEDWDPKLIAKACHGVEDPGTSWCMSSMASTFGIQDTAGKAGDVCLLSRDYELAACQEGLEYGRRIGADLTGGADAETAGSSNVVQE